MKVSLVVLNHKQYYQALLLIFTKDKLNDEQYKEQTSPRKPLQHLPMIKEVNQLPEKFQKCKNKKLVSNCMQFTTSLTERNFNPIATVLHFFITRVSTQLTRTDCESNGFNPIISEPSIKLFRIFASLLSTMAQMGVCRLHY